jgi:hypothetical protein
MPAALVVAGLAALSLVLLAVVHPHGPAATLRAACCVWAALTLVFLPLFLARS